MGKISCKYHKEILTELKANKGQASQRSGGNYCGHNDPSLDIATPVSRNIAKNFARKHQDLSLGDFLELAYSLYNGKYSNEKSMGGKLLKAYPELRRKMEPRELDVWLNYLNGWEQVDSICQSVFTAEDMLNNWSSWKKTLIAFAKNKNINKRRASLVLLTAPVRQSSDEKFCQLAFAIIERLKNEKEILITKAISWLLREMIKNHKNKVAIYLKENKESLPKIAVRETTRKLKTGRK